MSAEDVTQRPWEGLQSLMSDHTLSELTVHSWLFWGGNEVARYLSERVVRQYELDHPCVSVDPRRNMLDHEALKKFSEFPEEHGFHWSECVHEDICYDTFIKARLASPVILGDMLSLEDSTHVLRVLDSYRRRMRGLSSERAHANQFHPPFYPPFMCVGFSEGTHSTSSMEAGPSSGTHFAPHQYSMPGQPFMSGQYQQARCSGLLGDSSILQVLGVPVHRVLHEN